MKKILVIAPCLALLLVLAGCRTQPLPHTQDYTYTLNNGTITIHDYTGTGGDVTIPDTIDGMPVTSIGDGAFMCGGNLKKSIAIPTSVTNIVIGNNVISIGNWAFESCTNLTRVTIPNSVTRIGRGAFHSCISLTSVALPNSVTDIGDGAFWNCTSLKNVRIPNSVTSIESAAFAGCSSLTSITIPNSVTNIGERALCDCTNLAEACFNGNSPRLGGTNVFENCTNIIYYLTGTTGWEATFGGRPTKQQ